MSGILALIPARSGSKSIPDKNIRMVAGKPLLVHSIEHAHASHLIDRVIVSTDSPRYADIARAAGAEVPFLRPAALSGDHSTDLEVFTHALQWLEEHEHALPEACVHLRPTFPIRSVADIDAVLRVLLENPAYDSVRSIVPAPHTPFKMWFKGEDNLLRPVVQSQFRDAHNLPRQLLPQAYLQNACIDVVRTSVILEKRSMTGDTIYGYRMAQNFDIDTEGDIARLEAFLSSQASPCRLSL